MIKVEKLEVFNFEGAFRGLRNPMESWDKSDSETDVGYNTELNRGEVEFLLGANDKALAQKLILAGSDHRKFMRQIFVSMDITAPLYFVKELDTYKVATVTNSTSTMHKLATTPITAEHFSLDNGLPQTDEFFFIMDRIIDDCERLRLHYLETKDVRYWRALIQLLPSSWNQKRTWTADFEVLRNICHARENHKLQEWCEFVQYIYNNAPYAKELIFYKGE